MHTGYQPISIDRKALDRIPYKYARRLNIIKSIKHIFLLFVLISPLQYSFAQTGTIICDVVGGNDTWLLYREVRVYDQNNNIVAFGFGYENPPCYNRVSVHDIPAPGNYNIRGSSGIHYQPAWVYGIYITPGAYIDLGTIHLPPVDYGSLSGTITEPNGTTPIDSVRVKVEERCNYHQWPISYTNSNGYYSVEGSPFLYAWYNIKAFKAGYDTLYRTEMISGQYILNLELTPNQVGSLSGIVTQIDGTTPIEEASIEVIRNGYLLTSCVSAPDGNYSMINIPIGFYDIKASKLGFATQTIEDIETFENQITTVDFQLPLSPPFCNDFSGLFCDDFFDGVITEWHTLRNDGCTWSEANGELSTSNTGTQKWCILSVGDNTWGNYVLQGLVKGNLGVDKVLVFRVQDSNNFYAVNLRSDWGGLDEVTFDKMEAGTYNADIVTAAYPSQNGVWYHMKITCVDDNFTVFINGTEVLSYRDTENVYFDGGIGVACWTGIADTCDIVFDNVTVTDPFPHIIFDNVTGQYVGDQITISGHIEAWDGSIYEPLAGGTIGCEDPISLFSWGFINVDEACNFQLTPLNSPSYPALYDMRFIASIDGIIINRHLCIPIDYNPQEPLGHSIQLETGITVGAGPTSSPNQRIKDFAAQYLPPILGDIFGDLSSNLYGSFTTAWQRVNNSPTGKVIVGVRSWSFARCSWDPGTWNDCSMGVAASALQVINGTQPFNILAGAFQFAWADAEANGFLSQEQVADLNDYMEVAGIIQGIYKIYLDRSVISGVQAGQSLINAAIDNSILLRKETNPDGSIKELLLQLEDQDGNIYTIFVFPKSNNVTRVSSWCPVDLIVINPEGLIVSKALNQIDGAEYYEYDFNGDGSPDDEVIIPDSVFGNYQIQVIPDSNASPSDSFSLYAENTFFLDRVTLAENVLISDIPSEPYEITTYENLPPDSFSLLEPNGTVFASFPITFSWNSTTDLNPNHSVFYDLIISADSLFSDTVVVYGLIDTTYVISDSLPTDSLDNIYFWKVKAHDLWGESIFSNEVYYFIYTPQEIPTLSEWGMLILALLLLAAGTVAVVRRKRVTENDKIHGKSYNG